MNRGLGCSPLSHKRMLGLLYRLTIFVVIELIFAFFFCCLLIFFFQNSFRNTLYHERVEQFGSLTCWGFS